MCCRLYYLSTILAKYNKMIHMQQAQERIRNKEDLAKKQEKFRSKYEPSRPRVTERERGLSPGYLEDALEEVCATHSY
jgi:hypothetical protein